MTKVILLAQGLNDSLIARNLALFAEPRSVILLSDSKASWPFTTVSVGSQPLESLKVAALECNSDRLLILDAALLPSATEIDTMLSEAKPYGAITYFPVNCGEQVAALSSASANMILQMVSSNQAWPVAAISIDTNTINEIEELNAVTLRELMAQVLVDRLADGAALDRSEITINSSELAIERARLDNAEKARLLALTLDRYNIEEIFPEHNWKSFEAESAAACYHAFAALFIKLGDADSANACLQLSENFEDSPRSLALRAIIARERGEILGAVANMVSSLQQYELRKKNDGAHYVNFQPNNIEVISENLKSGLAALNKRNNESALEHFTAAVLNFDNFYQELGLDKIATRNLTA